MKNKFIVIILTLLALVLIGCENSNHNMYIDCEDTLVIEQYMDLEVYCNGKKLDNENLQWTLSDYNVANIIDGKLYGKDYGVVVIGVIDIEKQDHYCSKRVEIIEPYVTDIIITGVNEMYIDKSTTLTAQVQPEIIVSEITWESSNEEVILVDDGDVYAVGVGTADVIVRCDDFEKRHSITVLPTPTVITITGKTDVVVSEIVQYSFNIDDPVKLSSSNPEIAAVIDNAVVGVKEGTVVITAENTLNPSVKGTIEVTVKKGLAYDVEMTDDEKEKINAILENMTTEQMVGQMFNVGLAELYNGWGDHVEVEATTGLPYAQFSREDKQSVLEFLAPYKFGNFTVYGISGDDRNRLQTATKTLSELAVSNTGVKPFISIESSGGFVMNAITSLPTNQALSHANINVISEIGKLSSSELKALGINLVFNEYISHNDANDKLHLFGDDITKAMATAAIMDDAYQTNGVVFAHDTSIEYLYEDERAVEELQAKEYKLIESAILNGSQFITLPGTVFTAYNPDVTLGFNPEFIKDMVRGKLNYDGILMLDDSAISNVLYYEGSLDMVIDAINAGVDMVGFTVEFTTSRWSGQSYKNEANMFFGIYNGVIEAVNSGKITIDRIKESVTRILLNKLRNNILTETEDQYKDFNFNKVATQISNYAPNFITQVGGEFVLENDENILIVSEVYSRTGTTNSLGDCFRKFFEDRGFGNLTIAHCNTASPSNLYSNATKYDKIIIGVSTLNSRATIGVGDQTIRLQDFINEIAKLNPNVCVIATGLPDVMEQLPNVNHSILLYNYYENDFLSVCRVLNKEVELS